MMDTGEIMRKTQRLCDLVNAIEDERNYLMDSIIKTDDAERKLKYTAQLEVLDHLMKVYIL